MYVSAYPYPLPMVKYWKSDEPEAFSRIEIGISETYNQMQMCEEPANILAQNLFRNPGLCIFSVTARTANVVPLDGRRKSG